MIVCLVFVRQRVIFRGFARNQTVFVNTVNSDISGIHNRLDPFRNIYTAFLENPDSIFSFYKLFICTRFFVESIDIFAFVVYTLY